MPPTPKPETSVALHRGINFGNMLESPAEGEWGLVQEEYFDLVKEAGFDFVRLPVRWNSQAEEARRHRESIFSVSPRLISLKWSFT